MSACHAMRAGALGLLLAIGPGLSMPVHADGSAGTPSPGSRFSDMSCKELRSYISRANTELNKVEARLRDAIRELEESEQLIRVRNGEMVALDAKVKAATDAEARKKARAERQLTKTFLRATERKRKDALRQVRELERDREDRTDRYTDAFNTARDRNCP